MFDNLTAIGISVLLLWVLTMAYYFYTSRQQKDIQEEIEALQNELHNLERGSSERNS